MDTYQEDYREVSLVDIFALCVKKFMLLLLCAVIGTALVLGIRCLEVKTNLSSNLVAIEEAEAQIASTRAEIAERKALLDADRLLSARQAQYIALAGTSEQTDLTAAIAVFNTLNESASNNETRIKTLEDNLAKQESSLNTLKGKTRINTAKYALIGFLAGGFIGVVALVLVFVASERTGSSADFEKRLGAPMLGELFADSGFFNTLSRRILGERIWKTEQEAVRWFEGNLRTIDRDSGIALVCTCNDAGTAAVLGRVQDILAGQGYKVSTVSNAFSNPQAGEAIRSCDCVVLLERQFVSKWRQVSWVVDTANRFDRKIAGFVLC